ncbi:uncharacterized protein TRIADDRAFT_52954 [Trichoplax adhaerens]|uniref:Rho-GAP domain-containing protein n=1 Tax=Trichoplax adhaerens TaxID=10228 RepID=B3RMW8_TRIAD|nr:hypothetical protein TRIADDRAFT_52954 [Trichoplax adhaerens]EDV27346.1 hypothetical protein TRIADDRAFT_52954 [Trichoplax adhaerens]|eukprot:XP_002109180.1 hypothetical protein TRIADDRAFT_52954 [Trichoplax adhaerens]
MKKQFMRAKQIANQSIGRAEKTEISDKLQQIEKKSEAAKKSLSTVVKVFVPYINGTGVDKEKRLRKNHASHLGQSLQDCTANLPSDSVLKSVVMDLGTALNEVGKLQVNAEANIDEDVVIPISNVLENDGAAKAKKRLSGARLDMDSAKSRLNKEKERSSGSVNMVKLKTLNDEYENNEKIFNQAQDGLAIEHLQFLSNETMVASSVLNFVDHQMLYLKEAIAVYEAFRPSIQKSIEQSPRKKVFGVTLTEHLQTFKREIAVVLEECIKYITENAMETEGLFRITGSASQMKLLRAAYDGVGSIESILDERDFIPGIHSIAGTLKQYLRELPEPLMTHEFYDEWIDAAKITDPQERLQELWRVNRSLPKENYENLKFLITFLATLAENAEINKMSSSNLALVMAPNLLQSSLQGLESPTSQVHFNEITSAVQSLIDHCEWFFQEDCV